MKPIVEINNVIIEVTRRCNAKCEHCLRGDQQNINIKEEYVNQLFSFVNVIDCLTISGGEPSIAVKSINHIIDSAIRHNVEIRNFYIATNGLRITKPFVDSIINLYEMCTDNEISCVQISNDVYHPLPQRTEAFEELMSLHYVKEKWDVNSLGYYGRNHFDKNYRWKYSTGTILNSGKAYENGIGEKTICHNGFINFNFEDFESQNKISILDEMIYLNAKGQILLGCDFSFELEDTKNFRNRICHVDDLSLRTLAKFNVEVGEEDITDIIESLYKELV